ncbi:bifunctional diguanylate cyclase/phosphodiesterase [Methylibium sp. Root1272]|uniref:putative bifunctional diguanylate cyclase/phosphodiesterase n=1 Tax=Methylibium sp. Root1272 TaxID=1736441 RepID=UPI0006F3C19A|nr:EAL domain-containing protein [Methylibium sp. Root1272]KQW68870.1 diguanylate phosphodiesterase [Methylibium sp. Root1272]
MPLPAFLTPKRLQFRIVALFLGLLLVVQLASLLLIGNSISVNARSAVNAELRTAERVFERLLAQNAGRLTDAARLLASDFGFRAAVASNDGETLASALANQGDRIGASLAMFTDAQFRLKAATHDGAARFLPTLRQLATDPDVTQRLVMLDGEPYQLVAVPVKAPLTIGWVAMGFRIEAGLLQEMQQLSSIDVALLTQRGSPPRWDVLQSTLGPAASPQLVEQWLAARATQATSQMSLKDRHATLTLSDDSGSRVSGHLLARDMPLGREGEPQTVAVLMRSLDEATAPYRRLQWLLLAFTVVAIAVFAVVSVFTARRITTPLKTLAGSARRLGQGDYEQAVPVRTDDEIGELAQAFEAMRLAVREREGEVRRLAFEDGLTQLPNREQFRADLRAAILHAQAHDEPCAVLMLDLDRFKHVNDVLGHRFGDRLLQEVAKRLTQEARRSNDVVARLGGDEFVMLMPSADIALALGIAQRIQRAFERPISLDDHTVDLSAGIGIACCPAHGVEADTLVSRAELAMYAAKQHQLGVKVYDAALDMSSDESLSLLSELRTAVDRDQLRLYLQPKISLATGAVLGAEALVRWQHPQRGLVPPAKFIPFAEQTGFIRVLTGWMIERSAMVLRQLHAGAPALKISVNLSTRDLLDQDLSAKMQRLIDTLSLNPNSMCLEITESAIMDDPQRALQTLERLHAMGFKLSIDDFGTGYSSLAYLKRLPVDELKIDQSFVFNMERDLDDAKIVRSTIDLAHNLGLNVVAEGIETAKAWKLLQALGCDEAQGYFVAKPMPEALFADWIRDWTAPQVQAVRLDSDFSRLAL